MGVFILDVGELGLRVWAMYDSGKLGFLKKKNIGIKVKLSEEQAKAKKKKKEGNLGF